MVDLSDFDGKVFEISMAKCLRYNSRRRRLSGFPFFFFFRAPAPPEPLRTPHSLPMAGLKALAASGVSQGRGRGRGITSESSLRVT